MKIAIRIGLLLQVTMLTFRASGSVVRQSEQWVECRFAQFELEQFVRQFQRQPRVAAYLDIQSSDHRALSPCLLAKHVTQNTLSVDQSNTGNSVKPMKRYGNLFEQVVDIDNIERAYLAARVGKRHYREVKMIENDRYRYLFRLRDLIVTGKYRNSDYVIFQRWSGHKLRDIYKLPFYPDRIAHHAIVQVLQPIWMKLLIRDTFSTIPGRGIHDGFNRLKEALRDKEGTRYCLKFDVQKFYPSVNHDILKSIIRKKVKDTSLLSLLDNIVDSAPGIPIGNYISQWFGNLYLAYFDHYMKEQNGANYYFRYCDDIVALGADKQVLWQQFERAQRYLHNELHLNVKSNYQVFPTGIRGIDFLGYRFFHDDIMVRKSIVKAFQQKVKTSHDLEHLSRSAASYYGWFIHADAKGLINKYFSHEAKLHDQATGNS